LRIQAGDDQPILEIPSHHTEAKVDKDQRLGYLVLQDGSVFRGYQFGRRLDTSGEVVFSTSMVGYPEALTDPSYHGQILTLTYPLVGNYGVPSNELDEFQLLRYFESDAIRVRGIVVHELCEHPSHWTSTRSLDEWLNSEGVPGLSGVDTRRLTRLLRSYGVLLGALYFPENTAVAGLTDELKLKAARVENPNERNLAAEVSVHRPIQYGPDDGRRVVLVDCGVKHSIIRNLRKRNLTVIRVPHDTSAEEILSFKPKGIVLSNGPGDPTACTATIASTRNLLETRVPMMGICLGTQILAVAAGAKTFKMKYGHRSQNQPVIDHVNGRAYVTTQNHGYAIDSSSLEAAGMEVWFSNANDRTIEGLKFPNSPIFGVQWHPEATPGPKDTEFLFEEFVRTLR
jgi:carbamoyl-phosphate synthase small subunit